MFKKKSRKSKPKKNLDLNGDGKFDEEDKKLAGAALASKVEEPPKENKWIAKTDISRTYRRGSEVPQEQIDKWRVMGIKYHVWFD